MLITANPTPRRGVAGGLLIAILLALAVMLALYFLPVGGSSGSGSGSGGSAGTGGSYMQQLGKTRDTGFDTHAEQTLRQIVQLAMSYEISNGRYPRNAEELYEGVAPLRDPWGEPYTVEFIEGSSKRDITVRITSPGKDGIPGTEFDLVAEQKLP